MDEQNLESRISRLEARVDQLFLHFQPKPNPQPTQTYVKREPVVESRTSNKDSDSATKLLPIIAVICFVLAGVFIVRLAIDSGWLTPERQWGLLTLLGLTFVGVGRWLEKVDLAYRSYSSAAGVIVLYISAFSASLYFQIVPEFVSLAFALGVSVVCLFLFSYHRSEIFPIITCVGTYLCPLLLGPKTDLLFDIAFFLLWAAVFSYMGNILKDRTMNLVAAYLGIGIFTLLHRQEAASDGLLMIIAVLFGQFFLFAFGVFQHSVKNQSPLTQEMSMAYLPLLLFFYGVIYYFIDRVSPGVAPWISLFLGGCVYLLYSRAEKQLQNIHSKNMIGAFLGVILAHSGYLQILPDTAKPWLLPLFLLISYVAQQKSNFPKMAPILEKGMLIIGIIEYVKICFHLISTSDLLTVLPAIATIAVGIPFYFSGQKQIKDKVFLFLGLLHLLAILSLYRIVYDYGSLAVSMIWGVYSLIILSFGYQKKDSQLAKSSLVVLLIAALKALIYDAMRAPSGLRILSLLVTGVVLYGAGYLFKKIETWKSV